jgi:hypothetical protein
MNPSLPRRAVAVAPVRTLRVRWLVAATALASAALGMFAAPAGAVGIGGSSAFGLTPTAAHGVVRPYFRLSLSPGQVATEDVVLTNLGTAPETYDVSPSTGETAANTGSTYGDAFGPCVGVGCWISGLPATVTVAAGGAVVLPFRVAIPSSAGAGQYLAGVTARPANRPTAVTVGANGSSTARAVVIPEVSVGVAVTLGHLGGLTTGMTVTSVKVAYVGALPRLSVMVRNVGQTFARTHGSATCTEGRRTLTVAFASDTILPGDGAVVPVNMSGLRAGGRAACRVVLGAKAVDSKASSLTTWSGLARVPGSPTPTSIHVGPGEYEALPHPNLPTWALPLLAAVGVLLLGLIFVVLRLRRRLRPGDARSRSPRPRAASASTTRPAHARRSKPAHARRSALTPR